MVFKTGIDFSSPDDSCRIVCVLEMRLTNKVSFPHAQLMTMPIPSHAIDASKKQLHNLSQGIDSEESMPGALKFINTGSGHALY